MRSLGVIAAVLLALLAAPAAQAFDPAQEAHNFSRIAQRFVYDQQDPGFHAEHTSGGLLGVAEILVRDAGEGGERFSGSVCGSGTLTCASDPRMKEHSALVKPFTYINRNGAHIEGHVWTKPSRRAKARPGVVLQTGSVQAPEGWYLWAAQVLARHGYTVLTFDVQGQGRSDAFGTHDAHFADGFPAQDVDHFVEDLEDAIDFFHSTPEHPWVPPTAHAAARQDARGDKVDDFNPLHAWFDGERLGIVGHSLGAQSVSVVQGTDKRVDAVVAWDNLHGQYTPRVPALGMSADYGLVPYPNAGDPDPEAKLGGFKAWRAQGIPAAQINVRGGTHFEWSYSPGPVLTASLRGIDMAAWYTTAWLDRYVKTAGALGSPRTPAHGLRPAEAAAERRLFTDRWQADEIDAFVDAGGGGNLFSFYHRSPIDLGGGRACADLRSACDLLAADGRPSPYSYLEDR
jgi:dienelactone hydrolase